MYVQLMVQTEPDGEDFKATATEMIFRREFYGHGFTERIAVMEAIERLVDEAANEARRA
jgi:hypothetical protein